MRDRQCNIVTLGLFAEFIGFLCIHALKDRPCKILITVKFYNNRGKYKRIMII